MSQKGLTEELQAIFRHYEQTVPQDKRDIVDGTKQDLIASFNPASTIQPGDTLPDFRLPNAHGKDVTLASLLSRDGDADSDLLLITFYRGSWCLFCNAALRALQQRLPDFRAAGVALVAISPQLPDASLSTADKNGLGFEVLSDVGNAFARKLGLEWRQPEAMRPLMEGVGVDLREVNGREEMDLPFTATLLVDNKAVVRNAFIDPDWNKRLEPEVALDWVRNLKTGSG